MTTLNVPRISRKKPVDVKYDHKDTGKSITGYTLEHIEKINRRSWPSTFRVVGQDEHVIPYQRPADKPDTHISQYDKTLHLPSWYYNSHYEPTRNTRCRENCSVNFLRRNVKTLNDPVCYIPSQEQAPHWWPNKVPSLDKPQPPRQNDSTMRGDFQWGDAHNNQGTMARHTHNTTKPVSGTAPVNWLREDNKQQFLKEKISYEHQYDSRSANNYNNRARRQGAYIESVIPKQKAMSMLDNPSELSGWRTDSVVDGAQGASVLPIARNMGTLNHKRKSHFDIAPRSNLNVRVREYIPSAIENKINAHAAQAQTEPNTQSQAPITQAPVVQAPPITQPPVTQMPTQIPSANQACNTQDVNDAQPR